MLPGNLSSTAAALLNLTNTTVSPHTADSSSDPRFAFGFVVICFLALAICCLRKPTPLSVLSRLYAGLQPRVVPTRSIETDPLLLDMNEPNNGLAGVQEAHKADIAMRKTLDDIQRVEAGGLDSIQLDFLTSVKEFDVTKFTLPTARR